MMEKQSESPWHQWIISPSWQGLEAKQSISKPPNRCALKVDNSLLFLKGSTPMAEVVRWELHSILHIKQWQFLAQHLICTQGFFFWNALLSYWLQVHLRQIQSELCDAIFWILQDRIKEEKRFIFYYNLKTNASGSQNNTFLIKFLINLLLLSM